MTRPDFVQALRDADAAWSDEARGPLAARLDARLRARRERPASRAWQPVALFAGGVVAGVLLVVLARPVVAPAEVGGFEVVRVQPVSTRVDNGEVLVGTAGAELNDVARGLTVTAQPRTRLKREARGVRLVSGRGTFEVKKVPALAEPVRVLVNGADIEVRGTRFVVEQRDDGSGSVTLEEGRIVLHYASGAIRVLAPGETARWPEAPLRPTRIDEAFDRTSPYDGVFDAPSPLDQAFDAPSRAPPDDELAPLTDGGPRPLRGASNPANWTQFDRRLRSETTLKKALVLRESGDFDACVRVLEQALRLGDEAFTAGARERLSWELGAVLSWQLKDKPAACWQWTIHERAYPRGRYAPEVALAKKSLGCKP